MASASRRSLVPSRCSRRLSGTGVRRCCLPGGHAFILADDRMALLACPMKSRKYRSWEAPLRLLAPSSSALLCVLLLATTANAQTVWRMATEYPATAIAGEGLTHFAKLVGERSAGRLIVEPSYDASAGVKSAGIDEARRLSLPPQASASST